MILVHPADNELYTLPKLTNAITAAGYSSPGPEPYAGSGVVSSS